MSTTPTLDIESVSPRVIPLCPRFTSRTEQKQLLMLFKCCIREPNNWQTLCGPRLGSNQRRPTHCLLTFEGKSYDLQPGRNILRVTPKRVVDKPFEQIRRQQCLAGLGFDCVAHSVQPRGAGPFVELGDVVVDVIEVVLE